MGTVISVNDLKLDNTIKLIPATGPDPAYYAADNSVVRSEFYDVGNRVVFQSRGRRFSWTPSTMRYVDAFGIEDTIYTVQDVPLEVKANYARFNRAMPDVDDWFIQDNDRLKHQILLQGFQRDPLPWLSDPVDFVFGGRIEFDADLRVMAHDGLVITGPFETGGQIELVDVSGDIVFTLPQIVAYDSKIPERANTTGKYRVTSNEGGVLAFDIVVDNAWISSVERVYPIVIDPTVVVAAAYDTSGNGGRKEVALSNGWIVAAAYTPSFIYLYVSKDNGATWSQLCFISIGSTAHFALASSGTTVYCMVATIASANVSAHKFDATTVTNTAQSAVGSIPAADGGTSHTGVSLNIEGTGALLATGSAIKSPNTSSKNVWYSKSTDGGVTWSALTQITANNTTGQDWTLPCLVVKSNNLPFIAARLSNTTGPGYGIYGASFNGSTWTTGINIFNGGTFDQSNPCALVKQYGANAGRIFSLWDGLDLTDSAKRNVRAAYSDDGGATHTVIGKITTGNTIDRMKPVLGENTNGDVYVFYQDGTGISYQKCSNGTTTFGGATSFAATGTNPACMAAAVNSLLGVIFMDASQVKFDKLSFNTAPNAPTLTTEPNFDAVDAQTLQWAFSDPDAGNTQSAFQLVITKVADGTTSLDTGKVASTSPSYTLLAGALTNNLQYQWKVRTWDNSDVVGPYSPNSTFYTSAKPTTTITTPTTDGTTVATSNLTAAWSFSDPESEGQSAYQVKLTTSADVVLWDSGKVSDINARSLTINSTLVNTTSYKAKITTWDPKDVASAEAVRTFSTSFIVPATPTLATSAQNGYIGITITNPVPSGGQPAITSNELFRRKQGDATWIRIKTGIANNGSFNDYSVASVQTYEYMVWAFGANGTTKDSATASVSITFRGVWLHDVNDPAGTAHLFSIDLTGRQSKYQAEMTLNQFAGRTRPVAEFGESAQGTISVQLDLLQDGNDLSSLRALIYRNATLCYRDWRGRKMFGVIPELSEQDVPYGSSTTLDIMETAYSEEV